MAFAAACDTDVDGSNNESESTVCNTVGTSWWNQPFADQTGTFHVEFAASPSASNIDATIGLSNGPATKWTSLAAIVRFNPDGFIDARAGGEYKAVQALRYGPGTFYIRIDVDVRRHTYSAWASGYQGSYGSWNQVAADYPFRTEQASVTKLNNISGFVNPQTGPAGTVQICGFVLNATPATGSGCVASNAGGGFVNVATAAGVNSMIVDVGGAPSLSSMDGVIGISRGPADDYNDLAAAIRFYTNGRVEARDGDTYRADTALTYAPGESFSFKFVVDLQNKTYSVLAYAPNNGGDAPPVTLAKNYRFRPQQAGVTTLDNVASVVASTTGRVDVCSPSNVSPSYLRYARVGSPAMALFGGGMFVSDGTTTQKLDANGKIIASLAAGGSPAVDASGNLYLVRPGAGGAVEAYSPTLVRRWSKAFQQEGRVESIAANASGLSFVFRHATGELHVFAYSAVDGESGISDYFTDPQAVAAVSSTSWATAEPVRGSDGNIVGYSFIVYPPSGPYWTREIDGTYYISALAVGPDGSLVFGGDFYGSNMDFGDGPLTPINSSENGSFNGYFVALSPTGSLRYSEQTASTSVQDIDTDGTLIGVSNYQFTQFPWVDYGVYDTAGRGLSGCSECDVGLGHQGYSRQIAVSAHRVYLNVDEVVFWPDRTTFPFTLAIDF